VALLLLRDGRVQVVGQPEPGVHEDTLLAARPAPQRLARKDAALHAQIDTARVSARLQHISNLVAAGGGGGQQVVGCRAAAPDGGSGASGGL